MMEDGQTISKSKAKRDYLLCDIDLEHLPYSEVANPVRKGYTPMKVYAIEDVKEIARKRWGSLNAIAEERAKRESSQIAVNKKKSVAICENLNEDIVFEEMEKFMAGITLPCIDCSYEIEASPYFQRSQPKQGKCVQVIKGATYDDLCHCPIIVAFYDCMNREMREGASWYIKKRFPSLNQQVKKSPFNDRRKLGHYCWSSAEDKKTLLFALFVTNKWIKHVSSISIPPFEYAAFKLAIKRISDSLVALTKEETGSNQERPLCIGTFLPSKADEDTITAILEQLPFNVKLYCGLRRKQPEET